MALLAKQSRVKGLALARDVDGFPKLNEKAAIKWWPQLDKADRVFLKEKFSLDLEI